VSGGTTSEATWWDERSEGGVKKGYKKYIVYLTNWDKKIASTKECAGSPNK
jgi:hypothetical protein